MSPLTLPRIHGTRVGAAAVLTALTAAGATWLAAPAAAAIPGDNGDIKIHRVGVPFGVSKDDPVVCRFYLDAINFDSLTNVGYTIQAQPPLPNTATLGGSIILAAGAGHTEPLGLTDGQYRLIWSVPGGTTKEKAFRVNCREENERHEAQGPGGQIEDQGRGGQESGRDNDEQRGQAAWGRGDHDGPRGGVHAGGGGLVPAAAAFSPLTGTAAVGLVVVSGVVYFRMIRRRPHGAA
ncbi:hypothetical protein ACF1A5_16615 [Streptomyces sp. NPDC014864]|uniref:hypothetical protein n=1 Tax=Streptomyces sp. NPDC014864 TaxID=3364924 RepID=UPI0036FC9B8E